jgi:hypothetical protein
MTNADTPADPKRTLVILDHDGCNVNTEGELVILPLMAKYNSALGLTPDGKLPLMDMVFYNKWGKSFGNELLTTKFLDGYKQDYDVDLQEVLEQAEMPREQFIKQVTTKAYENREVEVIRAVQEARGTDLQLVAMDNLGSTIKALRARPDYEVAISCSNGLERILAQTGASCNTDDKTYTDWVLQQNIFCPSTHGKVLYPGSDGLPIRKKPDGDHHSLVISASMAPVSTSQYMLAGQQEELSRNRKLKIFKPDRVIAVEDTGQKGYTAFMKGAVALGFVPNFILNVSFQKKKDQQWQDALAAREAFIEQIASTGFDISEYIPLPMLLDGGDYALLPEMIDEIVATRPVTRIPRHNELVAELIF